MKGICAEGKNFEILFGESQGIHVAFFVRSDSKNVGKHQQDQLPRNYKSFKATEFSKLL